MKLGKVPLRTTGIRPNLQQVGKVYSGFRYFAKVSKGVTRKEYCVLERLQFECERETAYDIESAARARHQNAAVSW